jgi:hypothetical protein
MRTKSEIKKSKLNFKGQNKKKNNAKDKTIAIKKFGIRFDIKMQ